MFFLTVASETVGQRVRHEQTPHVHISIMETAFLRSKENLQQGIPDTYEGTQHRNFDFNKAQRKPEPEV